MFRKRKLNCVAKFPITNDRPFILTCNDAPVGVLIGTHQIHIIDKKNRFDLPTYKINKYISDSDNNAITVVK